RVRDRGCTRRRPTPPGTRANPGGAGQRRSSLGGERLGLVFGSSRELASTFTPASGGQVEEYRGPDQYVRRGHRNRAEKRERPDQSSLCFVGRNRLVAVRALAVVLNLNRPGGVFDAQAF